MSLEFLDIAVALLLKGWFDALLHSIAKFWFLSLCMTATCKLVALVVFFYSKNVVDFFELVFWGLIMCFTPNNVVCTLVVFFICTFWFV